MVEVIHMEKPRYRRTRVTHEELLVLERFRREALKPKKIKEKKVKLTCDERKQFLAPCLHCGHSDLRVVNLHHVNWRKYPKLVMPLCFNCHMLFHKLYGTNAVRETVLEVLQDLTNRQMVC